MFGHGQRLRGQRPCFWLPPVDGLGGAPGEQSGPQRAVGGGQAGERLVAQLFAEGDPGRVGEAFHGQGDLADQAGVARRARSAGRLSQRAAAGGKVEAAQLGQAKAAQESAPVRRVVVRHGAKRARVEGGGVFPGEVRHRFLRGQFGPAGRQGGLPDRQRLEQVLRDDRRRCTRAPPEMIGHAGVGDKPGCRWQFQQRGVANKVMAETPPAGRRDDPGGGRLVKDGQHGRDVALRDCRDR